MSNALVTLEQVRRHLRLNEEDSDGGPDDPDLELKILSASRAVLNYLKSQADEFLDSGGDVIVDSNGDPVVPYEVHAATLLQVGYLYKDRDENADGAYEQGYLPKPVTALLYPLRDPAVA